MDAISSSAVIPGALFLLGLVQTLAVVLLGMLRTQIREVTEKLDRGSDRMREHEGEIAGNRSRITVIERVCEMNHGNGPPRRRTDPKGFDGRDLRSTEVDQ